MELTDQYAKRVQTVRDEFNDMATDDQILNFSLTLKMANIAFSLPILRTLQATCIYMTTAIRSFVSCFFADVTKIYLKNGRTRATNRILSCARLDAARSSILAGREGYTIT